VLIKTVSDSKYKTTRLNVNWVTRSLHVHSDFLLLLIAIATSKRQRNCYMWPREKKKES